MSEQDEAQMWEKFVTTVINHPKFEETVKELSECKVGGLSECEKVFKWIESSERLNKIIELEVDEILNITKPLLATKSVEELLQVYKDIQNEAYARITTTSSMFLILGAVSGVMTHLDVINLGEKLGTRSASTLQDEIDEINAITDIIVKLPVAKLRLLKESLRCEADARKEKEEGEGT